MLQAKPFNSSLLHPLTLLLLSQLPPSHQCLPITSPPHNVKASLSHPLCKTHMPPAYSPPHHTKAVKYRSAEERAREAAAAEAEAEARRRAAADDAFERALQDMMGGALVRPKDEVADLAASRPAWMNGNPQVGGRGGRGGGWGPPANTSLARQGPVSGWHETQEEVKTLENGYAEQFVAFQEGGIWEPGCGWHRVLFTNVESCLPAPAVGHSLS